jgi:hypothetical protein
VLWRIFCNRGLGAQNILGNDSFDNRYRSGKSAYLICPRRGHAAVRTHKAVTQAVDSRLTTYIGRFKGKKALAGEERVAERLVYSRFFETQAANRNSTNGVDGLLAAMEDKPIEVTLHAAAKAQATQTFKHLTPGRGDGGNPDQPNARPDKKLKDKELKDKEKRARSERKTRHETQEARVRRIGLMVCTVAPIPATCI